jgi:hypothetical protein
MALGLVVGANALPVAIFFAQIKGLGAGRRQSEHYATGSRHGCEPGRSQLGYIGPGPVRARSSRLCRHLLHGAVEKAELVAFGIGEDHPGHVRALTDVHPPSAEALDPVKLDVEAGVFSAKVEVKTVLHLLDLRHGSMSRVGWSLPGEARLIPSPLSSTTSHPRTAAQKSAT